MFSNQSVRSHWLWFGPSPIAQGVLPFALYFFVNATSCAQVFGALKWYCLNDCGLYQMTLFEAALAGTPLRRLRADLRRRQPAHKQGDQDGEREAGFPSLHLEPPPR